MLENVRVSVTCMHCQLDIRDEGSVELNVVQKLHALNPFGPKMTVSVLLEGQKSRFEEKAGCVKKNLGYP